MVYLLVFAGLVLLALYLSRDAVLPRAKGRISGNTTSREIGSFEDYLARIESLSASDRDDFYVIAQEVDADRFIQVSAARDYRAPWTYQFDIPDASWSCNHVERIRAEANKRGLNPYTTDGGPMSFLDIDFATSGDHAVFARWVVGEVFGHGSETRYQIDWG